MQIGQGVRCRRGYPVPMANFLHFQLFPRLSFRLVASFHFNIYCLHFILVLVLVLDLVSAGE